MCEVMRDAGLDTVFLAAPTSTERRLKLVAEYSSGFVYLVSRTGITGEQQTHLRCRAAADRSACARITDLPLAMGFGISKPEHVAALARVGGGGGGGQRHRAADRARSGPKLEAFMREAYAPLGGGQTSAATLDPR